MYQKVTFKAHVMHLSAPRKQVLASGPKTKKFATLVDNTTSISAYFYGDMEDLKEKSTYKFINMQVRKDNETGEIYLTNPTTGFSIEDAEDFETLADVKPSPLAMSSVTGTVTVVGVKTLNTTVVHHVAKRQPKKES